MLSLNRSLHVSLLITALTVGAVALIGCGPDKHEAIPQSASLVTQGNGDLTFTAPHEGMAYVYDPGDHKLVYSGQMKKGQKLELDSRDPNSPIKLDGQIVQDKVIRTSHDYKIFFDDRSMQNTDHSTTIRERDREIERQSNTSDRDRM